MPPHKTWSLGFGWIWFQWVEDTKAWNGLKNPSNEEDCEIFVDATFVKIRHVEKAKFWPIPKDITPKLYKKSKSEACTLFGQETHSKICYSLGVSLWLPSFARCARYSYMEMIMETIPHPPRTNCS
jgi:hypothetical protein